jgi:hypothetical protein
MAKFPVDAPKARVMRTLEILGFRLVNEREHIAMLRDNADGTRTPLTFTALRRNSAVPGRFCADSPDTFPREA